MLSYFLTLFGKLANMILGIGTPQNFPEPLSKEKETEYFEAMKNGSDAAREKLILHNLRLVSHIVRKYYSTAKDQEDLVSIGSIGLVKAVDSFDHKNGVRFATYAARCIQNEILMYFRSQKKLNNEVSINDTIDVDRDGNPLTYIDVICTEDDSDELLDRMMQSKKAVRLVNTVLDERERKIIIMRYGLNGKKPLAQREVAVKLNISRSYVSRLEKSALQKLKEKME